MKERDLRNLGLATLLVVTAACEKVSAGSPIPDSEPVPATATFTPEPTAIPTETVTPTETPEPENRVAPKTPEDIYGRNIDAFERLEKYFGGGYFEGVPGLENSDEHLFVDFSHDGEIRIVESKELDDLSWGVYSRKFFENDKYPPALGVRDAIAQYLFWGNPGTQRGEQVVWGDLIPGTSIYFSETNLNPGSYQRLYPELATREDILRRFTPFYDERFTCGTHTASDGTPGIICTIK